MPQPAHHTPHPNRTRAAAAIAAVIAAAAPTTYALNITLNFDSANSETPAFDPTAAALTGIMTAAAAHWEDIVPVSSHNITINYRYETRSGSTLADMETLNTNGTNRVTEGLIRFDTTDIGGVGAAWYLDPTPTEDSEFDMEQTFYGDLTATNQDDWFNGSPPDQLEVGYQGFVNGSDPSATGNIDALSVALHEIGHALGLTGAIPNHFAEVADGDYDTDPRMLSGTSIGVETFSITNTAHLDNGNALMFPITTFSRRTRPSTADVIAADTLSDWAAINLRRKEVVAGPNTPAVAHFFDDAIWEGDFHPDAGTDAGIRHGDFINMLDPDAGFTGGDGFVRNLTVANNSKLLTLSGTITAIGNATFEENAIVTVGNGTAAFEGTLTAENITVGTPGLFATPATLAVINGFAIAQNTLTINPGSSITATGGGSVQAGTTLINNGLIESLPHPSRADNLFLVTAAAGATIDLDGTNEAGRLTVGTPPTTTPPAPADPAQATITLQLADDFNSTIDVNEGSTLTFLVNPWTLGAGGTLNLLSSTLDGTELNAAGTLNVTGTSNINAPLNLLPGGAVIVNSTLRLNNTTRYNGATSFTGTGDIQQNAEAFVLAPTAVDVTRFDLDGQSESSTINLDEQLTLNVDAIDTADNTFDGQLNINSPGRLTVNTPTGWTMFGSLGINGNFVGPDHPTAIDGAPFELAGTAFIDGQSTIAATLTLTGAMDLTNTFSSLILAGPGTNTIDGGQITGTGTLAAAPGVTLVGHGEVAPTNFAFDPTSTFLADSGTLEFPGGSSFTAGTIGTNSPAGTLLILDDWSTSQTAGLLLNGGTVVSAHITNDNTTAGHGTIDTETFDSPGMLNPTGILQINGTTTFDPATSLIAFTVNPPSTPGAAPIAGVDFDRLELEFKTEQARQVSITQDLTTTAPTTDAATPLISYGTEYPIIDYTADDDSLFGDITGTLVDTSLALAPLFSDTDADTHNDTLILRASIPGDLNLDNAVSVADLSTLALFFGTTIPGNALFDNATQTNSWQLGDFNSDGTVSVADLSLLALNFGFDASDPANPIPGGGLTFAAAARMIGLDPGAIPEPSTALTLAGALSLLGCRARRWPK